MPSSNELLNKINEHIPTKDNKVNTNSRVIHVWNIYKVRYIFLTLREKAEKSET